MLTAPCLITTIIGALVTIIAVERGTSHTQAGLQITALLTGTHIIITAVAVLITLTAWDRGINTSGRRITGIYCTAIPVITGNGGSLAVFTNTQVIFCTDIVVITGVSVIEVLAALDSVTTVIGTDVPVIAVKFCSRHTNATDTGLRPGTHVVIGTIAVLVTKTALYLCKHATGHRVTGVHRAAVPVIAGDGIPRAATISAGVVRRTDDGRRDGDHPPSCE